MARRSIGKKIGGKIYVHRRYEGQVVPSSVLAKAKKVAGAKIRGYCCVRYDPKTKVVAFQFSPDFDTAHEPEVVKTVTVKGSTFTVREHPGMIWHHKWQWVADDYPGFDVAASKARSKEWQAKAQRGDMSRIGRKDYWDAFLSRHGLRRNPSPGRLRPKPGWLRWSRVKKVVYHASRSPKPFSVFDPDLSDLGMHFGSLDQAEYRADVFPDDASIFPVWINVSNLLRLKDEGSFHADAIADQLRRKKIITKELAEEIKAADWKGRKVYNEVVRRALEEAGYDGIVYKNTQEGGGDSWLVWRPQQIKSVLANRGTYDEADPNMMNPRRKLPPQWTAKERRKAHKAPKRGGQVLDLGATFFADYHATRAKHLAMLREMRDDIYKRSGGKIWWDDLDELAEWLRRHEAELMRKTFKVVK